jgi:hypothetical protein
LLTTVPAWPQATPQATDGAKPTTEPTVATAEALPLITTPELFQVVTPDVMKIGKLLDFEKRDIRVTLRNISNQILQIEGTRLTCDCLSFIEETTRGALKPGDELRIAVCIDGGHMKTKPFVRTVLLDVAGQDVAMLYLTGEVIPMVSYAPTQVMNIGSFAGENVSWERTFTLKTAFPPSQQVTLRPPPDDQLFSYELTTLEPQSYSLVVRPKLPLPKGKFHHVIKVPVEGLDRYGPVLLAISGQVIGWRLMLENTDLSFTTTGMNHEETTTKEVRLVLRDGKSALSSSQKRFQIQRHSEDNAKEYAVAPEELASEKLKELGMWEALAKQVQAAPLPPEVTMTTSATPGAVIATLSFPPQFFSRTRRLIIPFYVGKLDCGRLIIQAAP